MPTSNGVWPLPGLVNEHVEHSSVDVGRPSGPSARTAMFIEAGGVRLGRLGDVHGLRGADARERRPGEVQDAAVAAARERVDVRAASTAPRRGDRPRERALAGDRDALAELEAGAELDEPHDRPSRRVRLVAVATMSNVTSSGRLPPPCTTVRPPCGPGQKIVRDVAPLDASAGPRRRVSVRGGELLQAPGALDAGDHHELAGEEAVGDPAAARARDDAAGRRAGDAHRGRPRDRDVGARDRPDGLRRRGDGARAAA